MREDLFKDPIYNQWFAALSQVHEVYDNPAKRCKLEKFLMVASGNMHRTYYNKAVG